MKLLVLGWYYSSNLGDAVICECVKFLLQSHYPDAEVVIRDMAGRKNFPPRKPENLELWEKRRRRQLLRNAATRLGLDKQLVHQQWCVREHLEDMNRVTAGDWNLVVFAGGQLFMDALALYSEYLCRDLAKRNIPVVFNACGTGPSVSPHIRNLLAHTLQTPNVRLVSCRDGAQKVCKWCGRTVAVPTDDPALWTDVCYGVKAAPSDTVGLGVMLPNSLSPRKTAAFWRRLVRELDRHRILWKFFTNGSERDMAFARTLLDGRREEDFLCPAPETPRELVSLIASFRSIIGFRLHSHILAASLGIPGVAMIWDRKLPAFFEKFGLSGRCFEISAPAEKVLRALHAAELAPPAPDLIRARREAARNLLLGAADEILKGEA